MLKVGHSIVPFKGKTRLLGYDLIDYQDDGFADANKYIPNDFDMCFLTTSLGKRMNGWWTGQEFYSIRLLPGDVIVSWRKCKDSF